MQATSDRSLPTDEAHLHGHEHSHDHSHCDPEDRQLLIDSRRYASEIPWKSWWHLASTLAIFFALMASVALCTHVLTRLACSLLIALTLVRMFILYHDYLHQTIFKNSALAGGLLKLYGHLMLTPPAVWKRSHDHHHKNNSKIFGATIGSFPIMTTASYQAASSAAQFEYRLTRSPWIIALGYFSVFLFGMCIYPLLTDFRRNLGVLGTLVLHYGTILTLVICCGWSYAMFAFVMPTFLAMLIGAYLFYIQHNFPAARVRSGKDWSYSDAALSASSYLKTGIVMRWFTGNIGYHHVHHLNAKIPFYRLPEAMAGLAGLQNPGTTSLAIGDIIQCLRLKLWDGELHKLVPFANASSNSVLSD